MFNEMIKSAIMIIICVLLLVAAAIIGRGNTAALMVFEKEISEDSLATGLYYSTQALPCMSKNPLALDETKRFVLDTELLDKEIASDYGQLSCADYGAVKYRIAIYDLDSSIKQWTFSNFQPQKEYFFMPRYGQVVALNDYLGNKHRAFIAVFVDLKESEGKYPNDVFCNSTSASESDSFVSLINRTPFDDDARGAGDAYKYTSNDCASKNCIKGPGQALATCQPEFHTYSKNAGEACYVDYECKSVLCSGGTCAGTEPPEKLINGQPCTRNGLCASNICAYDKRCSADKLNGIDISVFGFV